MKQITLEDLEPYKDKDLSVEQIAEKVAKDFDISVEEAESQICELMKVYTGERRHED